MAMRKKVWVGWLLAALWYGVICYLSAQDGTASTATSHWWTQWLWRLPGLSRIPLETLNAVVRQAAHGLAFFILTALLLHACRAAWPGSGFARYLLPWLLCAALAALDELHQWTVPGRAMEWTDWLTDVSGGLLALAVCAAGSAWKHRKQRKQRPLS